jgi:hypothetical protein
MHRHDGDAAWPGTVAVHGSGIDAVVGQCRNDSITVESVVDEYGDRLGRVPSIEHSRTCYHLGKLRKAELA